ncbi:MAG: Phosphate transporter, periplasmic phosphate-binding protein PstS [Myxococcaceae bacterium]|nr:Phosphate transporter, periplasmic phosphate-binding protein PstS [Myxococcaceae bacterium]
MSTTTSFLAILATAGTFGLVACDKTPPPAADKTSPAGSVTTSAADPKVSGKQTIRASGSSALQPLVNAAKEKYEVDNKATSVEVSAGGSKKGLADVASGAVHIGDSDIFAPDDMKANLVDHKVAVVGFAAMANKGAFNEKIPALTLEQMAKVFKGEVKNWKDLGGAAQPIVVINRAAGSGTRTVFGNAVLGGDKFVEGQTEDNSGALVAKLKQTKGAISYLALSFKDDSLVTIPVKTDKGPVDATPETITAGSYPIWAYEHMYTKGEATGATKQFLDYVLSPDFQTKVVPTVKGFIPVTQMKVTKDKD